MRSLVFEGKTWQIYEELRTKDRKLHKNLCKILKEMLRGNPAVGTGKPEPLKHNLSGFWSRRLSQKDRLIYKFDEQPRVPSSGRISTIGVYPRMGARESEKDERYIYVFAIGGHYEQF